MFGTGDLLAVYSDGITEAESPTARPFDELGLETALKANQRNSLVGDRRRSRAPPSSAIPAIRNSPTTSRFCCCARTHRRLSVSNGETAANELGVDEH